MKRCTTSGRPVLLAALVLALTLHTASGVELGDLPPGCFVIEAEHFDFNGGASLPAVSTLPYTGAEYQGLSAVPGVDYWQNEQNGNGEVYRSGESPNVPMVESLAIPLGKERPGFEVTTNYRIGWAGDGEWYDYTRDIPAGYYQAYAVISRDGGEIAGRLGVVAEGAGSSQQTVWDLGRFSATAPGGWGNNGLAPLWAPNTSNAVFRLPGGKTTLRFTTIIGDFDWFALAPAAAPSEQPADLLVRKGTSGAFAGDNLYQALPDGSQVLTQVVAGASLFQVQVQNDGAVKTNLTLRAGESLGSDWLVTVRRDGQDISTQLFSAAGYPLTEVAPGGTALLDVEVQPWRFTPAGARKAVTFAVFTGGAFTGPLDALRVVAVAGERIQPDLTVRRDVDAGFAGNDIYNATGAGQTRRSEVEKGTPAAFQARVANDGNTGQDFRLKVTGAPAGWALTVELNQPAGVKFDGIDDNIAVGGWAPGSQWTTEAWAKPDGVAPGRRTVVGGFNDCRDWGITLTGEQFGMVVRQPGGCTLTVPGGDPITPGQWYHLAVACDGTNAVFYIDGAEVATTPVDKDYVGTAGGVVIGSEACCGGNSFPGTIRDVRIWSLARSSAEIAADRFNHLTGRETGLQGWWRLEEAAGETAYDASPFARHGALRNGASWNVEVLDITAAATGAGYAPVFLHPNQAVDVRLSVTPGTALADGASFESLFSATAVADATKVDAVKCVTYAGRSGTTPLGANYTTTVDFEKGRLAGLEAATVADQLQLSVDPTTLPVIWVPNSNEGTISKVDTLTGRELARYRVCPPGVTGSPSRTTMDLYGNCWVANRQSATVVKVGLLENGQWADRNQNGLADTSTDRNGDGVITGDELLPWGQDECVLAEVVVIPGSEGTFAPGTYPGSYANNYWNPGPRGLAVDHLGNVWAGTHDSRKFYYLDGSTGAILRTIDVSPVDHTSYGAVIDAQGIVWSAGNHRNHVLRLDPADNSFTVIPIGHWVYGIGLDQNNHLFLTGADDRKITRFNVLTGAIDWTLSGYYGRGVCVTDEGDFWTPDSPAGTVQRFSNDGRFLGKLTVGPDPTGVAVDTEGKVWVVNDGDAYIKRMDPVSFAVDLSKAIPGTIHYGYSDMTGLQARTATTRIGFWSIVHDGRAANTVWDTAVWHADIPAGAAVIVKMRSSGDRVIWSPWEVVTNNTRLAATPPNRFLEIEVTLRANPAGASPLFKDLSVTAQPPGQVDLALGQAFTPNPARAEHPMRVSVTVTNLASAWASDLALTNPLPAHVQLLAVSVPGGSYALSNGILTLAYAGLPPKGAATYHLDLIPLLPGTLTNEVTVAANETDTQPANNRSLLVLDVQPVVCAPPPADAIAWWPGNGDAAEYIGGHEGGLYNGAGFVPGRVGQAFRFDGADDFVEVPDHPDLRLTEAVSVMFWAKRERIGVDLVLEKGGDWNVGEANYGVGLHNVNNNMFYFFFRGGWRGADGVADTDWHHYAVTAEHGRANPRFFVDGVERPVKYREGLAWINLYPSTRALHLGAQVDPRANYFGNLQLDEVQLFGRTLESAEVAANYDARSAGTCADALVLLSPSRLTPAARNRPYAAAFSAALGVPAYHFSLAGGALPAGLQLAEAGTLAGVPTQSGDFSFTVKVADSAGQTSTRACTLRVDTCVPAPEGLMAWWPGNGNADDLVSTNHGTAGSWVQYVPGRVGPAFRFFDHGESWVAAPNGPQLFASSRQLSIEAWVKLDPDFFGDKLVTILSKRDGCGTFSYQLGIACGHRSLTNLLYFGFSGIGNFEVPDGMLSTQPVPTDGQWHHVAATYNADKPDHNALLYLDGEVVGSADTHAAMPVTSWGPRLGQHGGCGYYSSAWIDEVSLYNRDLTAAEIQGILGAGAAGKCFSSPADLLIKSAAEPDAAFAVAGVFQTVPAEGQIEIQSAAPETAATYHVKLQNSAAAERAFTLRATEQNSAGWEIRYYDGDTEINSLLHSQDGWSTGTLAVGGSRIVRITATPTAEASGNTAASAFVTAFTGPAGRQIWDAVEARTTCLPVWQPDLQVRRDFDAVFAGKGIYNADGLRQTRQREIPPRGTAQFVAQLVNDGNLPARFILTAPPGSGGWTANYAGAQPGLQFDGWDDFVFRADSPALNPASFTLEGWYLFNGIGGVQVLMAKPFGSSWLDSLAVWLDGARLKAVVVAANGREAVLDTAWPHGAGAWHHVAYVFDDAANRHALLIDGAEVVSAATDVTVAYDAHPFLIGCDQESGTYKYFLNGFAREVRFWKLPRSAAEITTDMNRALGGTEPGLIGLWPLTDAAGGLAADKSPNHLDAELRNGPQPGFAGALDLTPLLTAPGGWSGLSLAPGQSYELDISVTAGPAVPPGGTFPVLLKATAEAAPAQLDLVKMVTSVETTSNVAQGGRFTTSADFELGTLVGVDDQASPDQLQLAHEKVTLPFLWVPNSNEGTISKVDTRTGRELGRYRVCPAGVFGNPSRTTVDQFGNCWVANRQAGTVVKVGLLEAGQWLDRNGDGLVQTSFDLNGDGLIAGTELLPWGQDECVLTEVVLIPGKQGTFTPGAFTEHVNDNWNPGPRGVAVDAEGNVWLGTNGAQDTAARKYYKVDGNSGAILATLDVASVGHTAYGAVVDRHGILWSSGQDKNHVLRLDTHDNSFRVIPIPHFVYGLNVDDQDHLFVSGWQDSKLTRLNVVTGTIDWTREGVYQSRGVAVTADGDVWVANTGPGTVTRWSNDGVIKKHIYVGDQPTGVAVDAFGKVWAVNFGDGYVRRIDPATDAVTLAKVMPGTQHYGYSDMTGIVSRNTTVRFGSWSVIHNARKAGAYWGRITWTATVPEGATLAVHARSSADGAVWSGWEEAVNGGLLTRVPPGKYLEVEVSFRAGKDDASPVLQELSVDPVAGPPELSLEVTLDKKLQLSTGTDALDQWLLEYTTDFIQWQLAPEKPVLFQGQVIIVIEPTAQARFFRLKHK